MWEKDLAMKISQQVKVIMHFCHVDHRKDVWFESELYFMHCYTTDKRQWDNFCWNFAQKKKKKETLNNLLSKASEMIFRGGNQQ